MSDHGSEDEKPAPVASRAPASRIPATMLQGRDAGPSASRAPASRAPPTMLQGRDSSAPVASRAPASRAPATMLQGRDAPISSRAPASRAPATMLQGRDAPPPSPRAPASRAPATMLQGRDAPPPSPRAPASRAPATMLQCRDNPVESSTQTLNPAIFASKPPAGLASVFITADDLARALKQTQLEDLEEDDREEQEAWAQAQIARVTNCPEGHAFNRVPYQGYQCNGGAHGISDHLLAEGLGGLLVIQNKGKEEHEFTFEWEEMEGPWYPNPKGKGYVPAEVDEKKKKKLEEEEKKKKGNK